MAVTTLPQKQTFIHFQDPESSLVRSDSCPGSFMPLTRTKSVGCPPSTPHPVDGEEDMETLQKTESVSTVYAWPVYEVQTMVLPIPARSLSDNFKCDSSCEAMGNTDSPIEDCSRRRMCRTLRAEAECRERLAELLADEQTPSHSQSGDFSDDEWSPSYRKHPTSWEDASTDGETPPHLGSDHSFSEEEEGPMRQELAGPGEGKKRWADLFGDEETPSHEEATIDMNGYRDRPHGKKSWADVFEDEQTPVHQQVTSDLFAAQ